MNKYKITAKINDENKVPYITFDIFDECKFIKHGFSTRQGGVSKGCFSSMNLGFLRGDADENVLENFRRICTAIGISYEDLVFTDQVHKDVIRLVGKDDRGHGITKPKEHFGIDGQITADKDTGLIVFSADCVPVLLADKKKEVIAAVHAGWRGTVLKIAAKAVKKMQEEFDSEPSDILAAIGPSICMECYEVSEDVAEEFKKAYPDTCGQFLEEKQLNKENAEKKYQLDLWRANEISLMEAGIPKNNIQIGGLCTKCNPKLFFSHRTMGNDRGSLAGFIEIR